VDPEADGQYLSLELRGSVSALAMLEEIRF
jgi:hypothetical protein